MLQFPLIMMKRPLLLAAFLVIFAHTTHAQKTITDSITSGGVMRYYNLYIPKHYIIGSSRPLIIHLHGYGSNGTIEQVYTNYMPIADTAGFLIVYPQGLVDANQHQYWNAGIPGIPKTPDDVAFISELIDSLHVRYTINRSDVYASGLSNGGYMCYQLAWKLSNKIAAIASVSGSMAPLEFVKCKPVGAVPVMEIHGTADNVVPYHASLGTTDIDTLLNFWIINDGCIPLPGITNLPDTDPTDGSTVIRYEWSAELRNTACELYKIVGGTHVDWPGGAGNGNNMDFNASSAIWQFFNRYRLSQLSVKEKDLPSSFSFYPDPCSGLIHIAADPPGKVTIVDVAGRKVLTSREKNIDVSQLASGCYQLIFENEGVIKIAKFLKF